MKLRLPKFIKLNQRINTLENEVEALEFQLHENIVDEVLKYYSNLSHFKDLEEENKTLKSKIRKLKELSKKKE